MNGSDFVKALSARGLPAWEAAALALARQGQLTPWPMVDLVLTDDKGNQAILQVATDVLSVGLLEDHVRLPLTPGGAQDILNLTGSLLPTPWLAYRIWQQAPIKLSPAPAPTIGETNRGADLGQYARHSAFVDRQIAGLLANAPARVDGPELVSGHKKDVVVSNDMLPKKVVIFGWYRPPPAPDTFDDRSPMVTPGRQPIQPRSNVHGDMYVDYSHGIRAIGPVAVVDGVAMRTADLYQHPTLWRLVSNEGPVRTPRYPSHVPVFEVPIEALPPRSFPVGVVPTVPGGLSDLALQTIAARRQGT